MISARPTLIILCLLVEVSQANQSVVEVPHDRTAAVQLGTAEQQIADEAYGAAVDFLSKIAKTRGDRLVRVSPTQLVRVRDRCAELMLRLPIEELESLRERQDPTANSWLERARQGEPDLLHRILYEAPLSTPAVDALFLLGSSAWEDGRPGLAYEYWRRLLPGPLNSQDPRRVPESRFAAADIAARLVLCRIAMNDRPFAKRELAGFRKAFPDAVGTLAGTEGKLADILQRQLEADWVHQRRDVSTPTWQSTWLMQPAKRGVAASRTVASSAPKRELLFARERVYFVDGDRVGEFNLTKPAMVQPRWLRVPGRKDSRQIRDIEVHGGLVLARTAREVQQGSAISEVTCLQTVTGRVAWTANAGDIVPESRFVASPVCVDGRTFVLLQTTGASGSLYLCGLDLSNGAVAFRTMLCTGMDPQSPPACLVTTSTHVTVVTNNGAVIATNHAGQPVWATYYVRATPRLVGTNCFSKHEVLVVAPADCDSVVAIRQHTGAVVWRARVPDGIRYIVGEADGTCVVSGRRPWGIGFATGKVRWGEPSYSPDEFGFGKPILIGDALFFPTREAVEIRSVTTGNAIAENVVGPGGHLTTDAAGEWLGVGSDGVRLLRQAD